jgi:hypothetical protein
VTILQNSWQIQGVVSKICLFNLFFLKKKNERRYVKRERKRNGNQYKGAANF